MIDAFQDFALEETLDLNEIPKHSDLKQVFLKTFFLSLPFSLTKFILNKFLLSIEKYQE